VRYPSCYSCGVMVSSVVPFHFKSRLSLLRHYLCNKYTLFMTFGYLWTFLVCMYGTIDPRHTYNEHLVLLAKSGVTHGAFLCLRIEQSEFSWASRMLTPMLLARNLLLDIITKPKMECNAWFEQRRKEPYNLNLSLKQDWKVTRLRSLMTWVERAN
jgi:hypothetical protein